MPATESQGREGDDISDSNGIIGGGSSGIEMTDEIAAAGGVSISKCTIPAAVEPRRVGPLTRQTSASRCAAACRSVPYAIGLIFLRFVGATTYISRVTLQEQVYHNLKPNMPYVKALDWETMSM